MDAGLPDGLGALDAAAADRALQLDVGTWSCIGEALTCDLVAVAGCADQAGCSLESTCTGTASSCATQTSSTSCAAQRGCTWTEECRGNTKPCSYYYWAYDCDNQDGCEYRSGYGCTGTATHCGSMSIYRCPGQDYCYVYRSCDGTPRVCDSLTTTECPTQVGCAMEDHCIGTARPCAELTSSTACGAQAGCAWVLQ